LVARFDYPSPYWDAVSEDAKDLINHLLLIDPSKRYTTDDVLKVSMQLPSRCLVVVMVVILVGCSLESKNMINTLLLCWYHSIISSQEKRSNQPPTTICHTLLRL